MERDFNCFTVGGQGQRQGSLARVDGVGFRRRQQVYEGRRGIEVADETFGGEIGQGISLTVAERRFRQ